MSNKKNASIIVATYNRSDILEKSLRAILNQEFSNDYEIIVVNDGSGDNTKDVLKKFEKIPKDKLKIFHIKHSGPDFAKNFGIKKAKYDIIVIMDDDCIPEKSWLEYLLKPIKGKTAICSSFSRYGGTSTAFLKKIIVSVGFFDLRFNKYNFRDDTDLVFRVLDRGYEIGYTKEKYKHIHKTPRKLIDKLKYGLKRIWIHQCDVLLYKKHPERTKEFLDIKLGFIRNPIRDFKVATGIYSKYKERRKFSLSSPQEIVLLQPKSIFHKILIFLGGIFYTTAVKFARLYGSIKYKKLLI